MMGHGMQGMGMMNGWSWAGGVIMWLIFLIIIVLIVVALVKAVEKKEGKENAGDILKKRYAKGEITKAEFERIKKDIM